VNTTNTVKGKRTPRALTDEQIMQAIGMLLRGDRQVDVALWFKVSMATINKNWKRRKKWLASHTLPLSHELPPRGPYEIVTRARLSEAETRAAVAETIVAELTALARKYGQSETYTT
jgi:uncharacterized protein YjcR